MDNINSISLIGHLSTLLFFTVNLIKDMDILYFFHRFLVIKMKISPRLCRPLNFSTLGGSLFCLYGRAGPWDNHIMYSVVISRYSAVISKIFFRYYRKLDKRNEYSLLYFANDNLYWDVGNPTLTVTLSYTTQLCSKEKKGITLLVTVLTRNILFPAITNRISHANANTVKSSVVQTTLYFFYMTEYPVQKFWWGADRASIGKNVVPIG